MKDGLFSFAVVLLTGCLLFKVVHKKLDEVDMKAKVKMQWMKYNNVKK